MLKKYLELTKPGIIRGNLLAVIAGFLLASQTDINLILLLEVIAGVSLVIASGCVLNNVLDIKIDSKMDRTKNRPLVTKEISSNNAVIFGTILGIFGFTILAYTTNWLAFLFGVIGWIFYIFIYGLVKRKSKYGTIVGAIPGATPPVAGYLAVTNQIDIAAIILFFILFFWQMPHFYAISLFRLKEYKKANIPIWPAVKGVVSTKIQMLIFVILFAVAVAMLFVFNYTGLVYLVTMVILSLFWLKISIDGLRIKEYEKWAKKSFGFSLLTLLLFCLVTSFEFLLP